ncbi:MAG: hypothetical protein KAS73_01840 [Candidatus Sabulitectum sp.]|nr:hypothetical protein [Candidatus Sabulitectum sp.]
MELDVRISATNKEMSYISSFLTNENVVRDSSVSSIKLLNYLLQSGANSVGNPIVSFNDSTFCVSNHSERTISTHFAPHLSFNLSNGLLGHTSFSTFLHDFQALMVHCSCVDFNNNAAVFIAMDEGGKTTAASLCKSGKVLSDDQIMFKKNEGGKWLAYGTPWTTFTPIPGSATPKAFFLLEKSDKFSLTKLGSRELLSHLWNEHYKSRLMIPKMYHTKILDLYLSLSSSAPVYLMKFPKDYIDQEAILKCLDH